MASGQVRGAGERLLRIARRGIRQISMRQRTTGLVLFTCVLALLVCQAGPAATSALLTPSHTPTPALVVPTPTLTSNGTDTGAIGEPVPRRDVIIQQTLNYYLSHMSLNEKIGQMMMFETYAKDYNGDMDQMVRQMHAGAIIIYGKNMETPQQLIDFIASAQDHTTIPMLVTTDEEGGNVDRLGYQHFNAPLPSAEYLGSTGDPQRAYEAGRRAARELLAYGINTDLAPVVDVRLVAGQVEGPRLYGNDAKTVVRYASAFLRGLEDGGIIGTLKHWPGIGSLTQDPHKTLPTINRSKRQLESVEFKAFRDMLRYNPGMIMVTHVLVPAIDPNMPATLSPKMVDGILRGELGYDSVVISDNLWMKGISSRYSLGEAAVLAVLAGVDLLEGGWSPGTLQIMINAVKQAVKNGRISMTRINESVLRILKLKLRYGMIPLRVPAEYTNQGSGRAAPVASVAGPVDVPRARSRAQGDL